MSTQAKCEKYKLVVPDGGWGYMIIVAVTINLLLFTSFSNCYGMLFHDLFIELNMNSTGITLLTGVMAACHSIFGFITSPLLRFISMRKLALIASIIFNIGQLGTVFVRSKVLLFIFQGVIQGSGSGVLFNLSFTSITFYFDKRRFLAMSIAQTLSALSVLVTPQIVKWSLNYYGLRGTILLLSAFTTHTIAAAIFMQPVSWHMKKVLLPETKEMETKLLLSENGDNKTPTIQLTNFPNKAEISDAINCENGEDIDPKKNSLISDFFGMADIVVLKKFILSIIPLGTSLPGCLENLFSIMLPQALYSMEWNSDNVAWAISLYGMGDLATRIVFILGNKWLSKFGSRELFVIGLIIGFVTRIGMLWTEIPLVIIIFLTAMGVTRCSVMLLTPLVVADTVGPEKFSSAMGIVMLYFGAVNMIFGPILGAVRDLTNSYSTTFYIMTSCYGFLIMFWCIELLYKKNKHKWVNKNKSSEKS